ncbi:MAG: hypothetical protein IT581_11125 [Verrucomicrobiales bacterium]|nr:hypothetical protein [Verrucomicrobiales bacterium]
MNSGPSPAMNAPTPGLAVDGTRPFIGSRGGTLPNRLAVDDFGKMPTNGWARQKRL